MIRTNPPPRPATAQPPRELRARSNDDRDFGVTEALALPVANGELDVYIGWPQEPVAVSGRRAALGSMSWDTAGPLLRERVLIAVAPLGSAGWRLDGTFAEATRWDVSIGAGGDRYEGCWIRLRR